AFARNLHQEAGAALCVHVDGRIVADLWGGQAAPGRPWQADTLVTTFSATKGVAATAMLCLHDRGLLDLDAPVADGWPEFAQAGKAAITVRQLLEHKAGLAWVDTPLTLEILADLPRLSTVLAAQAPVLPIGQQAYAATAWGQYVGVLFWKLTGQTLGAWLSRQVLEPLSADVHLGLPELHADRLARLDLPGREVLLKVLPHLVAGRDHDGRIYRDAVRPRSPTARSVANPPATGRHQLSNLHDPKVLATELPWVGAVASARGLSRLYAALARGGELDGVRIVREQTVAALAAPAELVMDRVLHKRLTWRQGFLKEEPGVFSPDAAGFGHPGAGGSLGWADPTRKVGFGYVMNRLDHRLRSPRTHRLCQALYACPGLTP
ncbi:beta-lactamase family protein, partial [Myxococcota bacterium]|nr:beta-lactamase family protein [Myxococcota bacterium]